jgi:hypothetical protein
MPVRRSSMLALPVLLAACSGTPPDPAIGFRAAAAQPAEAGLDEVVAAGGRVLGADAVRSVVASLGETTFLQRLGGSAGTRLVLRSDGAACLDDRADARCRRIVADGTDYRVFTLAGEPRGTLTPSAG